MSLYINSRTMEYPRYDGDVALAPNEPWLPVVETEPEGEAPYGFRWVEVEVAFVDGQWQRQWGLEAIVFDEPTEVLVVEEE